MNGKINLNVPSPRLPNFVKCPVCGKETQKKNVRNHLQLIHGIAVTHENYPEFARQKVSGVRIYIRLISRA